MTPAGEEGGAAAPLPSRVLRAIAYYKFAKVALLTAVGLGALKLLQPRMAIVMDNWASAIGTSRERRLVVGLLSWVGGMHPHRLEAIAIGAFVFAALFLVEGVGLWLGRRWAQYLTVIATTLFVPIEVFQLARHVTWVRAAALLLNLAIVALLVQHLRRHRIRGGTGAAT